MSPSPSLERQAATHSGCHLGLLRAYQVNTQIKEKWWGGGSRKVTPPPYQKILFGGRKKMSGEEGARYAVDQGHPGERLHLGGPRPLPSFLSSAGDKLKLKTRALNG